MVEPVTGTIDVRARFVLVRVRTAVVVAVTR
jgi:hypothetical protein